MQQQYFLSLGDNGFHRIAYTEWGDPSCAHVVVCAHGLARNSRDFDYLADELTPECRALCMDVVGRGESDWLENKSEYTFATYQRDAAAMLARAGAAKVDWVGTSMGGLIGMFLAVRPNSPIRRLVLNDVGALIPWAALFRMKGYITRGRRFSDLGEVEQYLRQVCAPFGPLSDEQWQHLARYGARREDGNGSSPWVLRYDPAIGEGLHGHVDPEFPIGPDVLRGIDLWNVWSKLACPTLVLRGAESEVLLPSTLKEMQARKPDLEVVEFPGIGHAPALMNEEDRGGQTLLARLAAVFFSASAVAAELPPLHADVSAVTVSGVSAGGYMAVQMHVAHSATVKGAAAIAGGPYYCAQNSVWVAYWNCMTPGWWTPLPRADYLKSLTDVFATAGRIDATKHLAGAPVWLFSGTNDHTVLPEVVKELQAYYALYGVKAKLVADKPAGHAMVTEGAGNKDCAATRDPYINDCDYDAAGELLKHLLGALKPPGKAGSPREFDDAYLYVPAACEKERCRVHVAFHGCKQSGERFPREAGYNRWAESNRLIVLYPQVKASFRNPRGCWDWWGYTDSAYATKDGTQIRAVWSMLERLSAPVK